MLITKKNVSRVNEGTVTESTGSLDLINLR